MSMVSMVSTRLLLDTLMCWASSTGWVAGCITTHYLETSRTGHETAGLVNPLNPKF